MRNRIQRSMLLIIFVTLLTSFFLLTSIYYVERLNSMKEEIKQEAVYVKTAIDILGVAYLEDMDNAQVKTRLTVIDKAGDVIYDSKSGEFALENHSARSEVVNAFNNGHGEALRTSETIGKQTYYYAILLDNGMVLRASKTIDNLGPSILRAVPFVAGVAGVMLIFAYYMSKWQTERLIAPINSIDPANPLENQVYPELNPLVLRIDDQNREKEQIATMRKEFSANVSHELKTPLTSISGYAEIMKSGLVKPEDMKQFSERIYNEASRLIVLIGDIIKLSKLDDENIELDREWVDLYALAREICSRLALPAEKKNVTLSLDGESVSIFGVHRILDEMIYNVCENAIKYNKTDGKVDVWVGNTLQGIKIIVSDTGIGIPAELQERIFERFFRVDKSHSKETGGTGLGLSIVKHAAIYHHAQINVESELGQGTKIEILFNKLVQENM